MADTSATVASNAQESGSVSTVGNTQVRPTTSSSSNTKERDDVAAEETLPNTATRGRDEEKAVAEATEKGDDDDAPTQNAPIRDPGAGFPEGGSKAWLCVLGSFFCLFCSFGWINAIGIFQEYYQENLLSDLSPSTVSWITSLETFFMFVMGPVNGKVFDVYGPRGLLAVGTFLHVFGLMMTSLSTQYYQFILAQGICSAIGASAVFFPAVSSTSTWFFHKRALALGIVASGSSLGGVLFPIIVQNLIPIIGFPWTMRVCAFIILGLLIISNFTVVSRLPPAKTPFSLPALYRCFTERTFIILTAGAFLFFFAMFIPFTYLILQAKAIGVDAKLASYLIPILNAVSILGRTLPGYLGDKFGRMNILISCCFLAGIITLAIWLPSQGKAPVVIYAVFFGFASGAFVGLLPSVIAQISPIKEIGIRNGNLFAAISVAGLVGAPIGGALIVQDGGHYTHLQIYAGVLMTAGSIVMFFARASVPGIGFSLAKKV